MEKERNFNKKFDKKNKKKNFTSAPPKQSRSKEPRHYWIPESQNEKCGFCEYVMSADAATAILEERNKAEQKIDPQKYLCDYVNSQYGLMSYCVCVKYV